MPTRIALLDTDAFRALGREALFAAKEAGWQLKTSPWCFFELLCHLDEEPDFVKAKGNLMKFRGIEIIDKPLDRAASALVHSETARCWSSDLCYAALAAIDAAQSFDDLANSVIVDEACNQRGPLKDVAENARRALHEAEHVFQIKMRSVIAHLRVNRRAPRSAERNHQVIMDAVLEAKGLPLPDTPDLDYTIIGPEPVTKCAYCFWSYFLLQAIFLEESTKKDPCELNDLEDGQLCAYVPLDEEMWVVAGDKKLRARLSETRDLLKAVGLGERAQFMPAAPDLLIQGGAP